MAVASGIIVAWPSTNASIPANWSRVTALDAQYIKGVPTAATNPGTTSGAATHLHTTASHVHATDHAHTFTGNSSSSTSGRSTSIPAIAAAHTHTLPANVNSATVNSAGATPSTSSNAAEPANLVVIYIQSDGTPAGFPSSCLAFFNNATLPTNWTQYTNGKLNFLKGAAAAGDGGGTNASTLAHTHTVDAHTHAGTAHTHTANGVSGGPSATKNTNPVIDTAGSSTHTHTFSATSASSATLASGAGGTSASGTANAPPWYKLAIIQNGVVNDYPDQLIAIWTGTIASIPATWAICDGTGGTPNLLSKFIMGADLLAEIGNTGGSATGHTHAAPAAHAHTTSGHTHASTSSGPSATTSADATSAGGSTAAHTHTATTDSTTPTVTDAASASLDTNTNEPPTTTVAYVQLTLAAASTVKQLAALGVG